MQQQSSGWAAARHLFSVPKQKNRARHCLESGSSSTGITRLPKIIPTCIGVSLTEDNDDEDCRDDGDFVGPLDEDFVGLADGNFKGLVDEKNLGLIYGDFVGLIGEDFEGLAERVLIGADVLYGGPGPILSTRFA